MCAICTPVQICTQVLICSTEFAPPTKVEQISTRVQICKSAPGCFFIKHRLHDQNTSQVQIYTPGVYLHWGVYCAYERGFTRGAMVRSVNVAFRGRSRIFGKGVHMYKGVGVRLADFISFFLNIPLK